MDKSASEAELIQLLRDVDAELMAERLRARRAELDEKAEEAKKTETWDNLFKDDDD